MLHLDDDFLTGCGLAALDAATRRSLLECTYAELRRRVGLRLAEGLSDAQIDEFSRLAGGDGSAAAAWLALNRPAHADVVGEELAGIRAELRHHAARLVAALVDRRA